MVHSNQKQDLKDKNVFFEIICDTFSINCVHLVLNWNVNVHVIHYKWVIFRKSNKKHCLKRTQKKKQHRQTKFKQKKTKKICIWERERWREIDHAKNQGKQNNFIEN